MSLSTFQQAIIGRLDADLSLGDGGGVIPAVEAPQPGERDDLDPRVVVRADTTDASRLSVHRHETYQANVWVHASSGYLRAESTTAATELLDELSDALTTHADGFGYVDGTLDIASYVWSDTWSRHIAAAEAQYTSSDVHPFYSDSG